MRPLPTDNFRPARMLFLLTGIALAVFTSLLTVWVHFEAGDRGYPAEVRRTLRKYGGPAAVPRASAKWLARIHDRTIPQVFDDLAAAAAEPSALDPAAPLYQDPGFLVMLYLDFGFLGFWLGLTSAGLLVAAPVLLAVNRRAEPPKRRRPDA